MLATSLKYTVWLPFTVRGMSLRLSMVSKGCSVDTASFWSPTSVLPAGYVRSAPVISPAMEFMVTPYCFSFSGRSSTLMYFCTPPARDTSATEDSFSNSGTILLLT